MLTAYVLVRVCVVYEFRVSHPSIYLFMPPVEMDSLSLFFFFFFLSLKKGGQ